MLFVKLFLCMMFCHVFDDYFLQGCLANLKQKSWWDKNAPDKMYKYDYLIALFMHCFSWTFMILLPIFIYSNYAGIELGWFYLAYPVNIIIHFTVDDLKANKRKINLIVDQSIHILQIVATLVMFYLIFNV